MDYMEVIKELFRLNAQAHAIYKERDRLLDTLIAYHKTLSDEERKKFERETSGPLTRIAMLLEE